MKKNLVGNTSIPLFHRWCVERGFDPLKAFRFKHDMEIKLSSGKTHTLYSSLIGDVFVVAHDPHSTRVSLSVPNLNDKGEFDFRGLTQGEED
jgi:hypothetical protein